MSLIFLRSFFLAVVLVVLLAAIFFFAPDTFGPRLVAADFFAERWLVVFLGMGGSNWLDSSYYKEHIDCWRLISDQKWRFRAMFYVIR